MQALVIMPTARQICNQHVVVTRPGEPLIDAARRMRDQHVGCLVVVDADGGPRQRKPCGILTDRDIVVGVLARTDRHLHSLLVSDVMTPEPVTVRGDEDLAVALKRMRGLGVRRMPIVDDENNLIGIISFDDAIEYLHSQLTDLATAVNREMRRERLERA